MTIIRDSEDEDSGTTFHFHSSLIESGLSLEAIGLWAVIEASDLTEVSLKDIAKIYDASRGYIEELITDLADAGFLEDNGEEVKTIFKPE